MNVTQAVREVAADPVTRTKTRLCVIVPAYNKSTAIEEFRRRHRRPGSA
jgi:hypothetical protein